MRLDGFGFLPSRTDTLSQAGSDGEVMRVADQAIFTKGVTVLHVSDLQYGPNHQFDPSGPDSLGSRLIHSLKEQSIDGMRPIDLVVVSGDIAEQGMSAEYAQAAEFMGDLAGFLDLPPTRFAIVPGNHDVNRALCQAYHLSCLGRDEEPIAPYSPKLEPYLEFLREFRGDPATPYAIRPYPDLGVCIAEIDSTFAESHEVHEGFCGEEQLQTVGSGLAQYAELFRVAVLHHNVRRSSVWNEDNLKDDVLFTQIIGRHVDLVLHGHTHDAQEDRLSNGVLVLSTGSTAIVGPQRPGECPNQYQVLTIGTGRIDQWGRRYEADQRRWTGDNRIGPDGRKTIAIGWPATARVAQALPAQAGVPAGEASTHAFLDTAAETFVLDPLALAAFRERLRPSAGKRLPGSLEPTGLLARLGVLNQGKPTRVAALLFSQDREPALASAKANCVAFKGVDRTAEGRTHLSLDSSLREQIDGAYEFVQAHAARGEILSDDSAEADVIYSYPMRCVREVLANAFVHRDYADTSRVIHVRMFADRLEVLSPGGWIGRDLGEDEVPLAGLASQSVRRNPTLAHVMGLVRYFEGEGSGIPVAVADAESMGAPPPTVRQEDGFLVVTIRPVGLDDTDWVKLLAAAERQGSSPAVDAGSEPPAASAETIIAPTLEPSDHTPAITGGAAELLASARGRLLYIEGRPGSGKSHYLRAGSTHLLNTGTFPLLLTGHHIAQSIRTDAHRSSLAQLTEALAFQDGTRVRIEALQSLMRQRPTVLLVDALDEVEGEQDRAAVLAVLADAVHTHSAAAAVVTSRCQTAKPSAEWSHYTIAPWGQAELQTYLSAVIPRRSSSSSAGSTQRFIRLLSEVEVTPFLATALVRIYRSSGQVPKSIFETFDIFFRIIAERDVASAMARDEPGRVRHMLGALAWAAITEDIDLAELTEDWCLDALLSAHLHGSAASKFSFGRLTSSALWDAVLQPVRGRSGYLRFAARSMAEFLAGEYIAYAAPPDRFLTPLDYWTMPKRLPVSGYALMHRLSNGGIDQLIPVLRAIAGLDVTIRTYDPDYGNEVEQAVELVRVALSQVKLSDRDRSDGHELTQALVEQCSRRERAAALSQIAQLLGPTSNPGPVAVEPGAPDGA